MRTTLITCIALFALFGCGTVANPNGDRAWTDSSVYAGEPSAAVFRAAGNTDPEQSMGSPGDVGPFPAQVVVTFGPQYDGVRMRFSPPAQPVLVSENNIEYSSGYAETYDPGTGINASFEVYADFDNAYTTMWIESQNDARIVVRWKSAIVAHVEGEGPQVAHATDFSGAPYADGYGDWVDETYYIYPDAVRTRYSRIYTAFADVTQPFGFDREPPNYVHEFMEATVWTYGSRTPADDLEIRALTLVDMNGSARDISFVPYPAFPDGFGEFEHANVMRINLNSAWKPFVIGRDVDVTIRPYEAETKTDPFQSWGEPGQGFATALAHMVNWTHYERAANYVSQVYLEGMTRTRSPGEDLSAMAASWLRAPEITSVGEGFEFSGYSLKERAYHIVRTTGDRLQMSIRASPQRPLLRPAFVISSWGSTPVESVSLNGMKLIESQDYHQGLEGTSLILWLDIESTDPVALTLEK